MKTNRFQESSFGKPGENGGTTQRPTAPRPARVGRSRAAKCETPGAAPRARRATEKERAGTVTARIDVGYGNALFIRGEGGGLSWEKGQPLVCVDGSTWVWSSRDGKEALQFKLLLNDQVWCRGENLQLGAGGQIEVVPEF